MQFVVHFLWSPVIKKSPSKIAAIAVIAVKAIIAAIAVIVMNTVIATIAVITSNVLILCFHIRVE